MRHQTHHSKGPHAILGQTLKACFSARSPTVTSRNWKSFSSERLSRKFMISDPESVATALRPMSGVKDVDVVQFPSQKELWIILRDPVESR